MGKTSAAALVLAISILTPSCVLIPIDRADTLIASAHAGNVEATRALIDQDYNVKSYGFHGLTGLMVAAGKGNMEMCRLLLERGADINAHHDSGSVLMWAVSSGNRRLVTDLLSQGADPDWKSAMGADAGGHALEIDRPDLAALFKNKNSPGTVWSLNHAIETVRKQILRDRGNPADFTYIAERHGPLYQVTATPVTHREISGPAARPALGVTTTL